MILTMLDFWELWLPIFNCHTFRLWITSHSSIWTLMLSLVKQTVIKLEN